MSTNLISLLQNPPISFEAPSNRPSGDLRREIKDEVIAYIKAGNYPSTALKLRHSGLPYQLYAGYRAIEIQDPVTKKTLYRIASMSKMVTAITVMQYVEKQRISLDDLVSDYLSAFANATVLKKVTPVAHSFTTLSSVESSAHIELEIQSPDPGLAGKQAGIQLNSPITGLNVSGIVTVTAVDVNANHVTVQLNAPSSATGTFNIPGSLDVLPPLSVGWSPYDYVMIPSSSTDPTAKTRAYYSTEPSDPVTIKHLLTHTAGISYAAPGFSADLQSLRTAIMLKKDPELVRFSLNPNLDIDAVEWANRMANIPMLFQPGTDWLYGPQIGVAGAVLMQYERYNGKNQSLYQIQKKILFDKLEIEDAGYFILDDDLQRAKKIQNLAHVYTNIDSRFTGTPTVVNPLVSLFANLQDALLPGLKATLMDGANPSAEGAGNPLHPIYGSQTPRKLELGDAGLYMKTEDMYKIVDLLRNEGCHDNLRLLKKETVDEMLKNQIGPLFVKHATAPDQQKWGYGFAVGNGSSGSAPLTHATAYWAGAFGSWWFADSSPSDTAFVLNSNQLPLETYMGLVNTIVEETHEENC